MNSELRDILSELKVLAQKFHGDRIANLTDDLLCHRQPQEYLLLVAEGVNSSALKVWINNIVGAEVGEIHLEKFIKEPTPVITAAKVVVLLECGKLLDANAVNILKAAVLSRPLPSYAIVFSSAEQITNEEELGFIERGARRLFVPDVNAKISQQLVENQIFFWNEKETNNFLSNRLASDQQVLKSWLIEPLSCSHDFERYQALSLINLAEEYFHNNRTYKVPGIDDSVRRLTKTKEEIEGCQRRLVNWLASDLTSLNSQLTTSLQTVKQNLLHGIGAYLQQYQEQLPNPALVTGYIERGINEWKQQSQTLLASRSQQIISDANNALLEVDWSVVNEVVQQYQQEAIKPDSLLQQLENTINSSIHNIFVGEKTVSPKVDDSSQNMLYTVGGAAGGALIASLAERLLLGALALPHLLPVVGAAAGVTLTGLALNRHQKAELLRKYTAASSTAIQEIISHIESQLVEQNHKITKVYQQILSRLQAVEEITNRHINEVSKPTQQKDLTSTNENQFADLRQRVLEMLKDDS